MKLKLITICVLILPTTLFMGCTVTDDIVTSRPTSQLEIDTEGGTDSEILLPTKISITEDTSLNKGSFFLEYCSENQEVTPEQMLQKFSSPLVGKRTEDEKNYVWVQAIGTNSFKQITGTEYSVEATLRSGGRWVAFARFNERGMRDVWVVSTDGEMKMKAVDNISPVSVPRFNWNTSGQLILWSRDEENTTGERGVHVQPALLLNPFTQETQQLRDMPKNIYQNAIWLSPDASSAIFVQETGGHRNWVIYDMKSGESQILSTLKDSLRVAWSPNDEAVALYLGELVIFDARTGTISSEVDLTPLKKEDYTLGVIGWDALGQKVAFEVFPITLASESLFSTYRLYVFDSITKEVFSYCLSPQLASNNSLYWSSDSKFLAWTSNDPLETVILEVATGQLTKLSGFLLIGWGQN